MTSSDFNMLQLEAPRDMLQITDGTHPTEGAVEITNPATWIRTMVRHQKQAERDLKELTDLCGNTIDQTNQRIQQIKEAYQTLAEGTRYIYDRANANQEIEEAWVRSELAAAANTYQTFAQNVWQEIIKRTQEANQQQISQALQLARVNNALAFLGEANTARNQHLATFQGNVELWAADHTQKMATVEQELRQARRDIQQLVVRIPLPPATRSPTPPPLPPTTPPRAGIAQAWWSPARQPSTSVPAPTSRRSSMSSRHPPQVLQAAAALTRATYPLLQSPIRLGYPPTTRQTCPPAIPPTPHGQTTVGGGNQGPPRPPAGPPRPQRSPTPTPPPSSHGGTGLPSRRATPQPRTPPRAPAAALTPTAIARIVGEGIAALQQQQQQQPQIRMEPRINTARLKMTNPESFDGKTTTSFATWWKSVTKYLGFYPETGDQQKIAWVGSLLTGTAKAWDLHRYDTLGEADTWANYSAAIRAEYLNPREAANTQLKLGHLKYAGDIRAYFTEFRSLNNYTRATGEGLQEKVDLAMTSEILRMRFSHNQEEFADDEGFLQATFQAGLQVERMKALEKARKPPKGEDEPKKKKGMTEEGRKRTPQGRRRSEEITARTAPTTRPRELRAGLVKATPGPPMTKP